MTDKERIATYVEESTVKKFRILAAIKNQSMSKRIEELITNDIENYEKEHGLIIPGGGGGKPDKVVFTTGYVVLKTA